MGEKVRDVGVLRLRGNKLQVELNSPILDGFGGTVHIHGNTFRMEMSEKSFYEMGAAVLFARQQLLLMKHLDGNRHSAGESEGNDG